MKHKTAFLFCALALSSTASFAVQMPAANPPVDIKNSNSPRLAQKTSRITMKEWTFHKTSDGSHPNNGEQTFVWLMNRARQNPTAEGIFLANSGDASIESAIDFFNVDTAKLQREFASYAPRPPAAFDVRLYRAALAHSKDLIARDAQDHNGQFDRVEAARFSYRAVGGSVFSYAESALNGHAAWNIDWGNEADGMQTGRGHRVNLMSLTEDFTYSNVGIALVAEKNANTDVGPFVATANYAAVFDGTKNHHNRFLVGTVWQDKNRNNRYDAGEGLANVQVRPNSGGYWAKTAKSGGYALPITAAGTYNVSFSGGALKIPQTLSATLGDTSILLDLKLTP